METEASRVTHISCFGADDGTAIAVGIGGTPPYIFHWDSINGQSGQNASNLTPGVHTIYVTDQEGCTASDTVVITEPDLLTVDIIDSLTVYSYCAGFFRWWDHSRPNDHLSGVLHLTSRNQV